MRLDTIVNVKKYLIKAGIADKADEPVVQNLSGGVSSSVWKIVLKNNRWVMKQPLGKLKVEEDWFSDVERIHREHEVMDVLHDFVPKGAIPKVLHVDYINHIYMMACAEEEAQTWKDILMEENFSVSVAENAAYLLREMHHHSNSMDAGNKAKFQDQKYFIQLRVDPFHRCLVQKYPELSSSIQKLIDEVTIQKTCLVHGDFSPKNMLVEKDDNIVLIDFEVAHWGNPVFDLAYCIGHLMLKGWYLKKHKEILKLIEVFLTVYGREVNNLIPHLGLMLLARMDGKSPVNYIREENMKNAIRKVAINWIQDKAGDTDTLQNIQKAFQIDL
jgi:aminoglycoside phosphotransferase (APT) family kinase protein